MTRSLPHLAARLFDTPLLVEERKAEIIAGVLAGRLGWHGMFQRADDHALRDLSALAEPAGGEEAHVSERADRRLFQMAEDSLDFMGLGLEGTGLAVIPVEGTLVNKNGLDPYSGMTGYDGIAAKLRTAEADPEVRGIVFDVDSPGGEVAGCFSLAAEIRAATKPTLAVASDIAYSAAYAIAASCDLFMLPRTGGAGSIGVVLMHVDFSQALDEEGIKVTLIHAGKHKVDGNPFEALPPKVRSSLQQDVENVRLAFAELVADGRESTVDSVLATEAEIYRGAEAVEAGLADAVMAPRDAVRAFAEELAGAEAPPAPAGFSLRRNRPRHC